MAVLNYKLGSVSGAKSKALAANKACIHTSRIPNPFTRPHTTHPRPSRSSVSASAAVEEEEDLWQYPDRDQWYVARFCATDQPDWNPASFVRSTQLAPGIREVVLDIEISRERVPLRNAYRHVGQKASVRINGGVDIQVMPSMPPFAEVLNKDALYRVRGDIKANDTKKVIEELTIRAELSLLVKEDENKDLYKAAADDLFEVGPFIDGGLDLRPPISAIFVTPTLIIFVEGDGIATAKALVEATPDIGGLNFKLRQDVRMYYRARNETEMLYKDLFEKWESEYGVRVATSTRDTFMEMFDDDDTLMYEPASTAAIILTGTDEEAEAAALEVCKEAEVTIIVKQSESQVPTHYLVNGKE